MHPRLKPYGQAWKIVRVMLSVYYAYIVEYRAELLFWVLSGTFPLIFMGVWAEAAQGGQFSLTPRELVQYFLAVFLVRQLTVVWVVWEFERELVEGRLSPYLLQPIEYRKVLHNRHDHHPSSPPSRTPAHPQPT